MASKRHLIMAMCRSLSLHFITLLLLLGDTEVAGANKGSPHWYVDFSFTAPAGLFCGKQTSFLITLSKNKHTTVDSVTVRFESLGGLSIVDSGDWKVTMAGSKSVSRALNVIIPCGDTSGLALHFDFRKGHGTIYKTFLATDDSVIIYDTDLSSIKTHLKLLEQQFRLNRGIGPEYSLQAARFDLEYWQQMKSTLEELHKQLHNPSTEVAVVQPESVDTLKDHPVPDVSPNASLLECYYMIARLSSDAAEVKQVEARLITVATDAANKYSGLARAYLDSLGTTYHKQ